MVASWVRTVIIVVGSVGGTTGFWAYLQSRSTRRDSMTRLTMGLAYAQLTSLGLDYLARGSITKDEFEDYQKYLFEPYKNLGGNGVAERIMHDVKRLPFRSHAEHAEIFQNREHEGWVNHVRIVPRYTEETPPQ